MAYRPNEIAVMRLVQIIENSNLKNKVTLLVIGKKGSKRLERNFKKHPWIERKIDVGDMSYYYSQAKISVAPIDHATGMQNKIIEAMAVGTPCVISSTVANAFSTRHEHDCLICKADAEYVSAIHRLLNDVELRTRLAANAKELINSEHSVSSLTKNLNKWVLQSV